MLMHLYVDATNTVPQKILVIDDSKTIHLIVRSCLKDEEVGLVFASNGAEGLKLA
jgi:CheY-like chemotaxis protein